MQVPLQEHIVKWPDTRMHPGAHEKVAPPDEGFNLMLVVFTFQYVQAALQMIRRVDINITACGHVAFDVLTSSKDMGHEHHMSATLSNQKVDEIMYQFSIVRFDTKHISVCVAPDVKETTYIQPYQWDALVVFSHPGRYSLGPDVRLQCESHVVCERQPPMITTGKFTDCL